MARWTGAAPRQRGSREVDALHARKVVRHRDGSRNRREVEERALERGLVGIAHEAVRASPIGGTSGEILLALTGTNCVVVDGHARGDLLETSNGFFVERLRECCAARTSGRSALACDSARSE
jgi:hypothetical protein